MKLFSFVIITFNRPNDTLALLQSICLLEQTDTLLQEVILLNNASTENYDPVTNFIKTNNHINFNYIESTENLGVSRGRNRAISNANAPFVIVVDDDTLFQTKDSLLQLKNIFQSSTANRSPAIISFKVLYAETLAIQQTAFPHKNFNAYKNKSSFEASYYPGCAHVIKKDVFEKVGGYPTDFFYGMEEYDLSYRILNEGFSILFSDKIIVHHKESPKGRQPKCVQLQMMWFNKSKVAWRYLPKRYFYSTSFLWTFFYLQKSKFDLRGAYKTWKNILTIPNSEPRKTLQATTLIYLKKLKARLWY